MERERERERERESERERERERDVFTHSLIYINSVHVRTSNNYYRFTKKLTSQHQCHSRRRGHVTSLVCTLTRVPASKRKRGRKNGGEREREREKERERERERVRKRERVT